MTLLCATTSAFVIATQPLVLSADAGSSSRSRRLACGTTSNLTGASISNFVTNRTCTPRPAFPFSPASSKKQARVHETAAACKFALLAARGVNTLPGNSLGGLHRQLPQHDAALVQLLEHPNGLLRETAALKLQNTASPATTRGSAAHGSDIQPLIPKEEQETSRKPFRSVTSRRVSLSALLSLMLLSSSPAAFFAPLVFPPPSSAADVASNPNALPPWAKNASSLEPSISSRSSIRGRLNSGAWIRDKVPATSKGAAAGLSLAAGPRRAVPMAALGGWFGGGGASNREQAFAATRRGMALFVKGDVEGSVREFDEALRLDESQRPYLWQRGLSLYYLKRFEEAAEQFRDDVAVNPNDTEESIWCFLSEAQLVGPDEARRSFLQVGRDPRPVMRAAYEVFQTGDDPKKILEVVEGVQSGGAPFYANLYVGLFHESTGNEEKAKEYLLASTRTEYGERSQDYMVSLAKVHCKLRGWA